MMTTETRDKHEQPKRLPEGRWSKIERWVPPVSLLVIPLVTVWLGHLLDAGKADFERFRYASEIITNERATPELKSWAISEISLFVESNTDSSISMNMQEAKLYALILGNVLSSRKGVYCYNILPTLEKIDGDISRQVDADTARIDSLDLTGLNPQKAESVKKYIIETTRLTASLRSSMMDGYRNACQEADKGIDEMAKKPFPPSN